MNYKLRKKLNEDVTNNSLEEKLTKAKQQLQNGADPKDVFDWVYDFHDGFAMVELDDTYNFINTNGELLSDRWFDSASGFSEGFASVELGFKYNFINTNGELLSDRWFDRVWDFQDGFAAVQLNGKVNFINTDGEILREDLWFDDFSDFEDDWAWVRLRGIAYRINTKGKLYYVNKQGRLSSVTESKRRVVRLTESQLRKTIKKVVTQCLNERKRR